MSSSGAYSYWFPHWSVTAKITSCPLYNHDITVYASEVIFYSFSVYGFNSGHFTSTYVAAPFKVAVAADTRQYGRALFKQITGCPVILDSADDLLRCINASSNKSIIHGYFIHSHRFLKHETEQKFCTVQAFIVRALSANRGLIYVWVFVNPSCDMTLACGLRRAIQWILWILSTNDVYYPDLGDTVSDSGTLFIGVHKGSTVPHAPVRVVFPPITKPKLLTSFLYAPFNKREYAVSVSRQHEDFSSSGCLASDPVTMVTPTRPYQDKCIYNIHRSGDNLGVSAGAGVL